MTDSILFGASRDFPRDTTLGALFDAVARRQPDHPALRCGDRSLSYDELRTRANRLAQAFVASGVVPGDRVGLLAHRSMETIVAMLAIVTCGAAYVPLDPDDPDARIAALIDQAGIRTVCAQAGFAARADALSEVVVPVGAVDDGQQDASTPLLAAPHDPEAAAYVLFTSGTTGKPKGVVVPHRAVARYCWDMLHCRLVPSDVVLHNALLTFDASTSEIWNALLHGATIAIQPDNRPSVDTIARALTEHDCTVAMIPTRVFHRLVDDRPDAMAALRWIVVGGDVLSPARVRAALAAMAEGTVVNGYGPTETTVLTTAAVYDRTSTLDGPRLPIGTPQDNTTAYVLDEQLRPVPRGRAGELYVGGDGLSSGYLAGGSLNAERFLDDPFRAVYGAKMYRTGDRVCVTEDGRIDFLGRIDDQAKISGMRIHPGEIAHVLKGHPQVHDAHVVVHSHGTDKLVVAYFVAPTDVEPSALQERAQAHLPEVVVPRLWCRLDALPFTRTGKLDTSALPHPELLLRSKSGHQAPAPGLEQDIAALWTELLHNESIAASDDFFLLGGDSLMAAQMTLELGRRLGSTVPVRLLFRRSVLRDFAADVAAHCGQAQATS